MQGEKGKEEERRRRTHHNCIVATLLVRTCTIAAAVSTGRSASPSHLRVRRRRQRARLLGGPLRDANRSVRDVVCWLLLCVPIPSPRVYVQVGLATLMHSQGCDSVCRDALGNGQRGWERRMATHPGLDSRRACDFKWNGSAGSSVVRISEHVSGAAVKVCASRQGVATHDVSERRRD
ncbi:hypothetical protein DFH06DRAFT_565733 [Mycena polygramma]|nr:hypothetical protein DFH06DRAFT_565386 [Mycena polygramma]KAJ7678073.1 hypothetical protein DFH06DRAFT_565733 [Mycena polygramma]